MIYHKEESYKAKTARQFEGPYNIAVTPEATDQVKQATINFDIIKVSGFNVTTRDINSHINNSCQWFNRKRVIFQLNFSIHWPLWSVHYLNFFNWKVQKQFIEGLNWSEKYLLLIKSNAWDYLCLYFFLNSTKTNLNGDFNVIIQNVSDNHLDRLLFLFLFLLTILLDVRHDNCESLDWRLEMWTLGEPNTDWCALDSPGPSLLSSWLTSTPLGHKLSANLVLTLLWNCRLVSWFNSEFSYFISNTSYKRGVL